MNEETYYHRHRHIGAWLLILVGIIFLLINTGVLPAGIWGFIFKLWPLILIFLGLRLTFGHSKIGNALIRLLELVVVILIILVVLAPTNPGIDNFLNQYLPWLPRPVEDSQFGNQSNSDFQIQ